MKVRANIYGTLFVALQYDVELNACCTHLFRFGIGRFTTEEEVDYTVQKCIQHAKRLREMRYVENTPCYKV